MHEDGLTSVIELILYLSVGSVFLILVFMMLRGIFRQVWGSETTQAAKEKVTTQSRKAKGAFDSRKAERELDKLLKLKVAGIITPEEFDQKAGDLKEVIRANALG